MRTVNEPVEEAGLEGIGEGTAATLVALSPRVVVADRDARATRWMCATGGSV